MTTELIKEYGDRLLPYLVQAAKTLKTPTYGELAEKIFYIKTRACYGCPIHCGHLGIVKSGAYKGTVLEGPEYETAAMLGGNCGVSDLYGLSYLNMLCDRLGLDSISAGGVLAFVMIIYAADTGGYCTDM